MGSVVGSAVLMVLAPACLAGWIFDHWRARRAGEAAARSAAAHGTVVRLLRLAAEDQRHLALTLLGHAEGGAPADGKLSGLARRLLDLADDLAGQTDRPDEARILVEDELILMPVVEFAVAQVSTHLGPSRRIWRIDPVFLRTCLLADRRAINQILVNVLSGAATATRDGDWIEITARANAADWCIIVQDEGIGIPVAQGDGMREASRGIGLRLTLARSLMQAHGGTLSVESTEHIGTRVRLAFPPERLMACPGTAARAADHAGLFRIESIR